MTKLRYLGNSRKEKRALTSAQRDRREKTYFEAISVPLVKYFSWAFTLSVLVASLLDSWSRGESHTFARTGEIQPEHLPWFAVFFLIVSIIFWSWGLKDILEINQAYVKELKRYTVVGAPIFVAALAILAILIPLLVFGG